MRVWLFMAAILGGLSVLLGAFAAHGLAGRLSPHLLEVFETGARYQMYHALAMGLAALVLPGPAQSRARAAAACFLVGIILFSGSLYALALTGISALGIVTPVGGLAFLVGWAFLALAGLKLGEKP